MNTESKYKDRIRQLLNWWESDLSDQFPTERVRELDLQQADIELVQFLRRLQLGWWQQQRQQAETTANVQMDQIVRWVQGDLNKAEIRTVKQMIADKPHLQSFHTDLQAIAKHIADVDRPDPLGTLQNLVQQITKRPSSTSLQPAWALRSTGYEPLVSPVPERYGFQIKLFVGGFDQTERLIEGRLVTASGDIDQLPADVLNADIWLLPEKSKEWDKHFQAKMKTMGRFEFSLPPGIYRLEMAWPGEFLEFLDVTIPLN